MADIAVLEIFCNAIHRDLASSCAMPDINNKNFFIRRMQGGASVYFSWDHPLKIFWCKYDLQYCPNCFSPKLKRTRNDCRKCSSCGHQYKHRVSDKNGMHYYHCKKERW